MSADTAFVLKPFPSGAFRPGPRITGVVSGTTANLPAIRYLLEDPDSEVSIPPPADVPSRRNELWRDTCFEFFLRAGESPGYLEFNLSPSGHWNVYRFENYRDGMREESAIASLPFEVRRERGLLTLALEVDLSRIGLRDVPLRAAVGAVLKYKDGSVTYWALAHGGPKPDFHRRDGFVLEL